MSKHYFQNRLNFNVSALLPTSMETIGIIKCGIATKLVYYDPCSYESLIPGNPELVAVYKGKLFCFSSEINQEKFMR